MIVKNLPEWHRTICERDGFKCCICGKEYSAECYFQEDNNGRVNQYIFGHHIKSQKAFPQFVLETDNGVCIDRDCHVKVHKGLANVPDGSHETGVEIDEETGEVLEEIEPTPGRVVKRTLPNGQRIRSPYGERFCKCGFIAQKNSGICMDCEKRNAPDFKDEKKKKRTGS